jgi:hypothetical protein
MGEQPGSAGASRGHQTLWRRLRGIAIFLVWLAYAAASTIWIHPLIWTVLPIGMALYLRFEGYPRRLILIFVAPVTLLTASSQAVGALLGAPIWVSLAIYVVASGLFSLVVTDPHGAYERLPAWLLGKRFATRLVGAHFEEATEAANEVVGRINASDDPSGQRVEIRRLAAEARREARRGGIWREAWATHAAWLEGLADLSEAEPSDDAFRHVNDLVVAANEAARVAIERAKAVDRAGIEADGGSARGE